MGGEGWRCWCRLLACLAGAQFSLQYTSVLDVLLLGPLIFFLFWGGGGVWGGWGGVLLLFNTVEWLFFLKSLHSLLFWRVVLKLKFCTSAKADDLTWRVTVNSAVVAAVAKSLTSVCCGFWRLAENYREKKKLSHLSLSDFSLCHVFFFLIILWIEYDPSFDLFLHFVID